MSNHLPVNEQLLVRQSPIAGDDANRVGLFLLLQDLQSSLDEASDSGRDPKEVEALQLHVNRMYGLITAADYAGAAGIALELGRGLERLGAWEIYEESRRERCRKEGHEANLKKREEVKRQKSNRARILFEEILAANPSLDLNQVYKEVAEILSEEIGKTSDRTVRRYVNGRD